MMIDQRKEKVYQEIKQEIRSILISSPKTKDQGLSPTALCFDYQQFNSGEMIRYSDFGFHSLLSFLRSMPDVLRIVHLPMERSYRLFPVEDESTAHIRKMVLEQRSTRKSSMKMKRMFDDDDRSFPRENRSVRRWNNYSNTMDPRIHQTDFSSSRPSLSLESKRILIPRTCSSSDETNPRWRNPLRLNSHQLDQCVPQSSPNDLLQQISSDEDLSLDRQGQVMHFHDRSSLQISDEEDQRTKNRPIHSDEESKRSLNDDEMWKNRVVCALYQCIEFRYQYHLCELDFDYRHYPSSSEIRKEKRTLQEKCFKDYEDELKEFQRLTNLSDGIDDEFCRKMFEEYIHLQRNYSYMMKFIRKFRTKSIRFCCIGGENSSL